MVLDEGKVLFSFAPMEVNKEGFFRLEFGSEPYQQTIALRRRVLRIPLGLDFSAEELQLEKDQHHFGWLQNGMVRACCILVDQGNSEFKLRQMAVEPSVQESGMGRKLVSAVENWARQEGGKQIRLHARQNAIPFYEKLGYEVIGDWFTEVGLPHKLMAKNLNS